MFKKISLFILTATMVLSVTGCNKNKADQSEYTKKTPPTAQTEDIDIKNEEKEENVVAQMQEAGEFDEILCYGDEYYLVKKTEDKYDGFKILVGVVNESGEWVYELSSDNIFAEAMIIEPEKYVMHGVKDEMESENFKYMGDGIFIASMGLAVNYVGRSEEIGSYVGISGSAPVCYFFNVKENAQTSFEARTITPYDNGYMLMYQSRQYNSNFCSVNTKGEIEVLPCIFDSWLSLSFPAYSDGVFFAENKFFDIQGNVVLDISQYNLYGKEYGEDSTPPYFENGECTIKFRNDGGTLYQAVIDKQGNFIEEPTKISEAD